MGDDTTHDPGFKAIHYGPYRINRKWCTNHGRPQPDEWEWVHGDYDGPGDNRCGTATDLMTCIMDIDEIEGINS